MDKLPVQYVSTFEGLFECLVSRGDAALLQRRFPPQVKHWLDSISPSSLPTSRHVLKPYLVGRCVCEAFASAKPTNSPALKWLSDDIAKLANAISEFHHAELVRLRMETIEDNACSKLHIDNVVARLICTYRGPGTEMGFDSYEDTDLLAAPTGMPLLLKGSRWAGKAASRLRHRSPQIQGTGITRFVVVLEHITQAEIMPGYDIAFTGGEQTID